MGATSVKWGQTSAVEYVDSRIYNDGGLFERELAEIWKKVWVPACHVSELPEPYDYRTLTIAREPVIVCRGEDGKVRAFLNVCPHRANLIVRSPAAVQKNPKVIEAYLGGSVA